MLDQNSLVFCSGTLLTGSIQEMVEAAVAGGYDAVTFWPQDVQRAHAEGLSNADIRTLLSDHGLSVADLDPLLNWSEQSLPKPGDISIPMSDESEFYAIAEAFGARSLNIAHGFAGQLDLDAAAEDLAGVCDRAREHGLLITVEFTPWSGIPDVATAHDLVKRTGCANATVLVDTWHWYRGGADLDQLRALPGELVGSVQLNDAPAEPWDDVITETMQGRLNPGEGDIPLVDVIRVLDEIGSTAPLGVEVFRARHASMTPAEVGKITADTTRAVLAKARA